MYIQQFQLENLKKLVTSGKVVIVFGPRRVGKTTLLKHFLETQENFLFVSGEDVFIREYLASGSIEKLKEFVGSKALLVIDEAQYIPDIGLNLKLITDHLPHVKVIATGSSTFDLVKQVGEPLTGRKAVLQMYTLSQMEIGRNEDLAQTRAHLERRLIFGSYPEVVLTKSDEDAREYLHELVSSYLLKDILAFEGIQKAKKLIDLLILLAFQIGKEVSHSELATGLGMSRATIERYLDLLEKVFILINVRGFSRNLRKEVSKTSRYYFSDNGIRNALVNNFNLLSRRDDQGALWENYLVTERLKKQEYQKLRSRNFFWRTYDQKELDWVEEREGQIFGFEFKWGSAKPSAPKLWTETYPEASYECIHPNNYLDWIS